MKTGNEIIASWLGWEKAGTGYMVPNTYPIPGALGGFTEFGPHEMDFDRMDWLYPVYLKLRKELMDFSKGLSDIDHEYHMAYYRRSAIEVALIQGDIAELHSEIVKGIQFITENKK